MSELPAVGTVFEEPGFRAAVIGRVSGLPIFEVDLHGAVSAHAAKTDELAIITQGVVRVTINDEVFIRHAGEWLIIPAGAVHDVEAVAPTRMLVIG